MYSNILNKSFYLKKILAKKCAKHNVWWLSLSDITIVCSILFISGEEGGETERQRLKREKFETGQHFIVLEF